MKILFFCGNPKDALLRSLKKLTDVQEIIKGENLNQKNLPKANNILFLLEQQPFEIPKKIEDFPGLKVAYLIDSHLHFATWHKYFAQIFDIVFFAQKKYAQKARNLGINAFWLPLYCDSKIDTNLNLDRIYDIGFIGTKNFLHNPRRSFYLWLLKKIYKTKIAQNTFGEEKAKILNQSKIAFNISIAKDLNFRTFESMACGAMLLTDKQDGMSAFFKNKKHLVIYKNFSETFKLASYYLENEKMRQEIAKESQNEAGKHHSSDKRAEEIIRIIKKEVLKRKEYEILFYYALGRTYFFNYKKKEAITYLEKFVQTGKGQIQKRTEAKIFLTILKYFPNVPYQTSMILLKRFYKALG